MTYGSGYRPGDLTAVVGLRTAILMSAPADGDLAVRLWPAVETGDSLDAFLDVLTSVGIRALPDLALVCGDWCNGELAEGRILVRGALTATVHRPEGTEELTADGAATWREWLVRGVRRVVLGRPGPA
ncbi:MAG TPA: hypothetical protein VFC00_40345, partial [Micromonosporaceae bacterium]|nr:hypothetical protein [Micromonosporaceae bacterium]